ncbi:MAG: hypothetical protein ACRDYC_02070 [Acidimicrobiales bacterium]
MAMETGAARQGRAKPASAAPTALTALTEARRLDRAHTPPTAPAGARHYDRARTALIAAMAQTVSRADLALAPQAG